MWVEPRVSRIPVLSRVLSPDDAAFAQDGCVTWSDLPQLQGRLWSAALGRKSATIPIEVQDGRKLELRADGLTVEPPAMLRLMTDDGVPVSDAKVVLRWRNEVHPKVVDLRAREGGRVEIPYVDVGTIGLEITAPCCARYSVDGLTFAAIRETSGLRLQRVGEITGGSVRGEDPDQGLRNTEVCIRHALGGDDDEASCVTSEVDGSFRLAGVAPGTYNVRLDAASRPIVIRRAVGVMPGQTSDLGMIPIPGGARIRVLVTDDSTSDPIPGAEVSMNNDERDLPGAKPRTAKTNGEGVVLLDRLPEGTHPLIVQADGYAPVRTELSATAGDLRTDEIRLASGGAIEGTVLRNGAPAVGDRIEVPLVTGRRTAEVGPDGRYALTQLPPGRIALERIALTSGSRETREVSVREGETSILNFGEGRSLNGTVWRGGSPVPGARLGLLRVVSWGAEASTEARQSMMAVGSESSSSTEVQAGITDLQGRFLFEGLDAGEYSLTIHDGLASQTRRVRMLEQPARELDVELDRFKLWGEVRSADADDPLGGSQIIASPVVPPMPSYAKIGVVAGVAIQVASWEEARAQTSADGTFQIELPNPGPWRVGAVLDGYVSQSIVADLSQLQQPLKLTLAKERKVNVWVEGPGGVEARGARVHQVRKVLPAGPDLVISESVDSSGLVVVTSDLGGEVWIVASHPVYGLSPVQRIPPANVKDVIALLSRGATVTITAAHTGGSDAYPRWDVRERQSGISLRPFLSDPQVSYGDGTVTLALEHLPPGEFVFQVNDGTVSRSLVDGETLTISPTD
jgi:hypothetical protein